MSRSNSKKRYLIGTRRRCLKRHAVKLAAKLLLTAVRVAIDDMLDAGRMDDGGRELVPCPGPPQGVRVGRHGELKGDDVREGDAPREVEDELIGAGVVELNGDCLVGVGDGVVGGEGITPVHPPHVVGGEDSHVGGVALGLGGLVVPDYGFEVDLLTD